MVGSSPDQVMRVLMILVSQASVAHYRPLVARNTASIHLASMGRNSTVAGTNSACSRITKTSFYYQVTQCLHQKQISRVR